MPQYTVVNFALNSKFPLKQFETMGVKVIFTYLSL